MGATCLQSSIKMTRNFDNINKIFQKKNCTFPRLRSCSPCQYFPLAVTSQIQNTSKSQKQSWEQHFNSFRANTPIYSNAFQYSIANVVTSLHAYDFRRKRSYIICHIIMKSHEINENVHKKCVRFFLGNASDFKRFLHLTLSISNTGNIRWQYQAISKLIAQFFCCYIKFKISQSALQI